MRLQELLIENESRQAEIQKFVVDAFKEKDIEAYFNGDYPYIMFNFTQDQIDEHEESGCYDIANDELEVIMQDLRFNFPECF